jgi:hypothetical protein
MPKFLSHFFKKLGNIFSFRKELTLNKKIKLIISEGGKLDGNPLTKEKEWKK